MPAPGTVVVLNGPPRSGKSSLAAALQEVWPGPLLGLGVDAYADLLPSRYRPGLGLRPGGERPDLEPLVVALVSGLYAAVGAHSAAGLDVVVDIGHHDDYSRPLGTLQVAAGALAGCPAYLVGVHCPLSVVLQRRAATGMLAAGPDGEVPEPVRRWQRAVHDPGVYDLEVDTSRLTPAAAAAAVLARVVAGPGTAWDRLRRGRA